MTCTTREKEKNRQKLKLKKYPFVVALIHYGVQSGGEDKDEGTMLLY